jgi:formate-dependent nitrite reductase cytochrome c552 subunit
MDWDAFNHTPSDELTPKLYTGPSCADCYGPKTMDLVIARPAFLKALSATGVDRHDFCSFLQAERDFHGGLRPSREAEY